MPPNSGALPLQTPACALAALRACARSGGALPCTEPPPAPVKRRSCGGSVVACVCRLLPALRLSRDVLKAHNPRRPPAAMMVRLRALLARLRALLARLRAPLVRLRALSLRLLALWIRLRAWRLHLLVLWVHLWVRGEVGGRVVRRRVAIGSVVPSGVGAGHVVGIASRLSQGSLVDVRSVRVVGSGESAAARVAGWELALSGVPADASGGGPSSDGWRRTCVCGI